MKTEKRPCLVRGCKREYRLIVVQEPWLVCRQCAKKRKATVMSRRPKEVDYATAR
jgi:hypothetical protein